MSHHMLNVTLSRVYVYPFLCVHSNKFQRRVSYRLWKCYYFRQSGLMRYAVYVQVRIIFTVMIILDAQMPVLVVLLLLSYNLR